MSSIQSESIEGSSSNVSGNESVVSSSQTSGSTNGANFKRDLAQDERRNLAGYESKRIGYLRIFVLGFLVLTAAGVSYAVYHFTNQNEVDNFESNFNSQAIKVLNKFHEVFENNLGAMDSFATSITSYANGVGAVFPNVTIPDFVARSASIRILASGLLIYYCPLVTDENRAGWEAYSAENQGQFMDSFKAEEKLREKQDRQFGFVDERADGEDRKLHIAPDVTFHPEIYDINRGDRETGEGEFLPEGSGPFFPVWQLSPVLELPQLMNMDFLTFDNTPSGISSQFKESSDKGEAIMGISLNLRNPEDFKSTGNEDAFNSFLDLGQFRHKKKNFLGDPASPVTYPVFDSLEDDRRVAGMLYTTIYWRLYFENVLPQDLEGMIVVLENTGGQSFTFRLDGPDVTYVANADAHDNKYDYLEQAEDISQSVRDNASPATRAYTTVNLNEDFTSYTLRVYPSDEFRSTFVTIRPTIYTIVVALVFIFTSAVFMLYDCLVERRQTIVMDRAVKSSAVVSSLFPESVRDRLYQDQENKGGADKSERKARSAGPETSNVPLGPLALRSRKAAFQTKNHGDVESHPFSSANQNGSPIADEFQATTVLFADLVQFTHWSSTREPKAVFQLLETIYGAFDKLALKHKVFKVETIGDCYLAVTGLPHAQPDHAQIMCKFASDCVHRMRRITRDLSETLGPDTTDLQLRVGLHSGPVTAGVLRGQKSRFQLFGDTVNTAARMESTGVRGLIHCSQATADELIKFGKSQWLKFRDGGVDVKGKGRLMTYFVNTTGQRSVDSGDHRRSVAGPEISVNPGRMTDSVDLEEKANIFVDEQSADGSFDQVDSVIDCHSLPNGPPPV